MDGDSGFYVYGGYMKRRTFIKCLVGTTASGIACITYSGTKPGRLKIKGSDKEIHGNLLYGKKGGCSTPACNESSAVQFEQALQELDSRLC